MSERFVENYINRGKFRDKPRGKPLDYHNNPNFRNEMQALVYLQTLIERLIQGGILS